MSRPPCYHLNRQSVPVLLLMAMALALASCDGTNPPRPSATGRPTSPAAAPSHSQTQDASVPALTTGVGATAPTLDSSLQTPRTCTGAIIVGGPGAQDDLLQKPKGPWKTVAFAVKNLAAGQTACVQPGTYDGRLDTAKPGSAGNAIWIMGFPNQPRPILTNFEPTTSANAPFVKIDQPFWALRI
jgi:hypothetical protein